MKKVKRVFLPKDKLPSYLIEEDNEDNTHGSN
jgi:hypothetical protein